MFDCSNSELGHEADMDVFFFNFKIGMMIIHTWPWQCSVLSFIFLEYLMECVRFICLVIRELIPDEDVVQICNLVRESLVVLHVFRLNQQVLRHVL